MRLALLLLLPLAACGTGGLFGEYDVPEAPGTAEAPWPRLVDTPPGPAPGVYSAAVPDPAMGVLVESDLNQVSRAAGSRAGVLAEPVVDTGTLDARVAAAQARAKRLAAPVLTEAERRRLAEAARGSAPQG